MVNEFTTPRKWNRRHKQQMLSVVSPMECRAFVVNFGKPNYLYLKKTQLNGPHITQMQKPLSSNDPKVIIESISERWSFVWQDLFSLSRHSSQLTGDACSFSSFTCFFFSLHSEWWGMLLQLQRSENFLCRGKVLDFCSSSCLAFVF